jgi:RimJ/RimL family protein N-acetyltransferase
MNNLKPIIIENEDFQIHPLRKSDELRFEEIWNDLFEIFGDRDSLPYSPEKFVDDKKTLLQQLIGVTIGYQDNTKFTHFITAKQNNKTIGKIIVFSPLGVQKEYGIEQESWFIEYYLNKDAWNLGLMSVFLDAIINQMKSQGVKSIGALVDRENIPSIRVLKKTGFKLKEHLQPKNDYYEI